jgi:hypothetical protein
MPDNSVRQEPYTRESIMKSRIAAATLIAAVAATFAVAGVARAADKTHVGKVVSVAEMKTVQKDGKAVVHDGKLVMTEADGKKEHAHTVFANTKITLNKKSAKLGDLKKGDAVSVTTDAGDKVTAIAATREAK